MGSLYTNRMKKKTKKTIEDRPFVMSSVSFTENEVDEVLNHICHSAFLSVHRKKR